MNEIIENSSRQIARYISDEYANTLECKAANLNFVLNKGVPSAKKIAEHLLSYFRK